MSDSNEYTPEQRREWWGWFGEPWPSGICYKSDPMTGEDVLPYEWDYSMQVPTPVGIACMWCEELIVDGDRGQRIPNVGSGTTTTGISVQHRECALASVVPPPPGLDLDPEGMPFREYGKAVWNFYARPFKISN